MDKLQEHEDTRRTEQKKITSRTPDNKLRNDTQAAIREITGARSIIENNVTPPPANLTVAEFSTQSFDELQARINAANAANPDFGWPEDENVSAENRALLERAMIDARTTQPTPEFTAATDSNVWGIPEYDLLALDTAAIRNLMDERSTAIGQPVPSDTEIDALRNLARTRHGERTAAITQIDHERERAQRTVTRERERIERQNHEGEVAVFIKNLKTGKIVSINGDSVYPTASLVKVPILVGIMDKLNRGELQLTLNATAGWIKTDLLF